MESSTRHHYIPEFFIKSFVGTDGLIAVYNKKKGKLEDRRKSPKQIFYEPNRNNFKVKGKTTDFVEGLYQFGESKIAPSFHKMLQNGLANMESIDFLHIGLLINLMKWRIPASDEIANKIISESTNKDLMFTLNNISTGEEASKELYDEILGEPAFKGAARLILATIDTLGHDILSDIKRWTIVENPISTSNLLGDNPIIQRDLGPRNLLEKELIFPISNSKSLILSNGGFSNGYNLLDQFFIDVLTFEQSEVYACGSNSEYLEKVAEGANKSNKMKNNFFELKEKVFKKFD